MTEKNIQAKVRNMFQELYRDKLRLISIVLVFMSFIFFITMLIGGSTGAVFINKFTFDEGIAKLLQKNSIKFTMLGYCIDDKCTKDVGHDFDKAPSSGEIQSGEVNKRSVIQFIARFDPGEIANDAKDKVDDVADVAEDVGKDVGDTAEKVGDKAEEVGKEVGDKAGELIEQAARELLSKLLEAFDNFRPKESTSGISGWISKPIIAAAIFNFVALLLLFFVNKNNATLFYFLTIILLLISIILNLASLITTSMLFSLVFNIIGAFPGIGDNDTGAANGLSICSLLFLIIALMSTIARSCSNVGNKVVNNINNNNKETNESSNV